MDVFLNLICIISLVYTAYGGCPQSCLCSSNVIVCSCAGKNSTTLGSFQHIDYISKVYIHTCPKLFIPRDTFKGIAIGEQLNIFGIGELHLEKGAFRLMTKCPDELIIRDTTIPQLPSGTFSGLHKLKHLWFKGGKIGHIQRDAFQDVYQVEYLYFRDVQIDFIEGGAFGGLKDVDNFFVRGSVKIDRINENIFAKSEISEIFFEDVTVKSASDVAFGGLQRGRIMKIEDAFIERIHPTHMVGQNGTTENLMELEIKNCKFDAFSIAAFSNTVNIRIVKSDIKVLQKGPTNLKNIGVLRFSNTVIRLLGSGVFENSVGIKDLIFDDGSEIPTVDRYAFQNARKIDNLIIISSNISTISTEAFVNVSANSVVFDGNHIGSFRAKAFMNANFNYLRIVGNQMNILDNYAFQNIKSDKVILERNNILNLAKFAFHGAEVKEMQVSENKFLGSVHAQAWHQIGVTESFHLQKNVFQCQCNAEFTQLHNLQTRGPKQTILYQASENRCFGEKDNISRLESTFTLENFHLRCEPTNGHARVVQSVADGLFGCVEMNLITECSCIKNGLVKLDYKTANRIPQNGNMLILRDCEHLVVKSKAFDASPYLVTKLSHHKRLEIESKALDKTQALRRFEILQSEVSLVPGSLTFSILDPVLVLFQNCRISNVPTGLISQSRISTITFDKCNIGTFEQLAFEGAWIDNVTLLGSDVGFINNDVFHVDHISGYVTIKGSVLDTVERNAVSKPILERAFRFARNRIACPCSLDFLEELLATSGLGEFNTCNKPMAVAQLDMHIVLQQKAMLKQNSRGCIWGNKRKSMAVPVSNALDRKASGQLLSELTSGVARVNSVRIFSVLLFIVSSIVIILL